jgi:hypothetical protein
MISKLTRVAIAVALMTSLSGCIMYVGDGKKGEFHHYKTSADHKPAHDEKPAEEVEKTAN